MAIGPFKPCFLLPTELQSADLPTPDAQANIMALVELASTAIDEFCGRIDTDGNGSLAYSTYQERLLLQTRNRNLCQLAQKPVIGIPQTTIDALVALANSGTNYYYTGVLASTFSQPNGNLSGIIAASGRYSYSRQDVYSYPDQLLNPINLITIFGGPAPWVAMAIPVIDYDGKTGEAWVPSGLQLQRYSEVDITYNSGFDPRNMPALIKLATVALTKNILARGGGTTGLLSLNVPRSASFGFSQELIDPTIKRMLVPFQTIRAY